MRNIDDKINVLHLRDSPWVDGPGRTILETASAIDNDRCNYIIGAFDVIDSKENPLVTAALERNLKVFQIKETGSLDLNIFRQVLNYIDENNIHILHTHEFRSDLIGLVCAKIRKIPIITTLHGWIANGLKGKFYVILDKAILRFFDHIIVVSNIMKEQVQKLRVPESKISVLYNSLIIDRYQPHRSDNTFRRELGLDENTVLVGNIGRLSPEKGQDIFIHAANEVSKKYKNIRFVLIGIGPDQERLERLAEQLCIENMIIFTGYRNDMLSIYNSLNLVVQSSHTEGMPNVILEALLMEVPVVATNVGGTSEIIKDYKSGVLIPASDHQIITKKIMEYMENSDLYIKMANMAKMDVQQHFNFQDRTRRLMSLYESIDKNY
jgi:glycosyltransferase involved in cell wall biosynthesis